jgi:hypothetical protein
MRTGWELKSRHPLLRNERRSSNPQTVTSVNSYISKYVKKCEPPDHRCLTRATQICIMRPVAIFVNYARTIKITQNSGRSANQPVITGVAPYHIKAEARDIEAN